MAFQQTFNNLAVQQQQVLGTETVAADGAASLTVPVTLVDASAGTVALSIANTTTIGLTKTVVCTDGSNAVTITPATFLGGSTITLATTGEAVVLLWVGAGGWTIIGSSTVESGGAITNGGLVPRIA